MLWLPPYFFLFVSYVAQSIYLTIIAVCCTPCLIHFHSSVTLIIRVYAGGYASDLPVNVTCNANDDEIGD
jgi:hypothetical protein